MFSLFAQIVLFDALLVSVLMAITEGDAKAPDARKPGGTRVAADDAPSDTAALPESTKRDHESEGLLSAP